MLLYTFECENNPDHRFSKTERKLAEEKQSHRYCWCGGKYKIVSTDVVHHIGDLIADDFLNKWMQEMGIEGCIEFCEKYKDTSAGKIYMKRLKERGLIK